MARWLDPICTRQVVCFIACFGLSLSSLEWLIPPDKLRPAELLAAGCLGVGRAERLWRPNGLRLVLILRLICAIAYPLSVLVSFGVPDAGFCVLATGLLCLPLRLRKPVGILHGMDGAEHLMTSTALVLGLTFVLKSALALEAALTFVAVQALLEYASAGWTKLRAWRGWASGAFASQVMLSSNYGNAKFMVLAKKHPFLLPVLSTMLVALEIAIPFTLVLPLPITEILLGAGFIFHVTAAVIMGLNTFVWAFPATYPAILHLRYLLLSH